MDGYLVNFLIHFAFCATTSGGPGALFVISGAPLGRAALPSANPRLRGLHWVGESAARRAKSSKEEQSRFFTRSTAVASRT